MVTQPVELIIDFVEQVNEVLPMELHAEIITHVQHFAPHTPPQLPRGNSAVYAFSLTANCVATAGPNRILKVGKVGAGSAARFQYQHYGDSTQSTLAKAIRNNPILWTYIGYPAGITVTSD